MCYYIWPQYIGIIHFRDYLSSIHDVAIFISRCILVFLFLVNNRGSEKRSPIRICGNDSRILENTYGRNGFWNHGRCWTFSSCGYVCRLNWDWGIRTFHFAHLLDRICNAVRFIWNIIISMIWLVIILITPKFLFASRCAFRSVSVSFISFRSSKVKSIQINFLLARYQWNENRWLHLTSSLLWRML